MLFENHSALWKDLALGLVCMHTEECLFCHLSNLFHGACNLVTPSVGLFILANG